MRWFLPFLLLAWGCSAQNDRNDAPSQILTKTKGVVWLNYSYLTQLRQNQSAKFSFSHGMTEIYLDYSRSLAWLLDGDWEPLPYQMKQKGDSVILTSVDSKQRTFRVKINPGNAIAICDSGYHFTLSKPDTHSIIQGGKGFYTAMRKSANKILIAGTYSVHTGPAGWGNKKIIFYDDGTITGLDSMSKYYRICLTGDCKRYCDETDIIYMSPHANEPGGYWRCFKKEGNKLTIWKAISKEWMSNWPDIQPDSLWLVLYRN